MSTLKNFSGAVANKKRQAGLALLEMIIAIGILGVISAAVVMLSTKAFSSMNVKDTVAGISALDSAIKNTYRAQGNFAEIHEAFDKKILDRKLAKNPFGGEFVIKSVKIDVNDSNSQKAFSIKVAGLTSEQCQQVVQSVGDSFAYVGTKELTQLRTAQNGLEENVLVQNGEVKLSAVDIQTACQKSANDIYLGNY